MKKFLGLLGVFVFFLVAVLAALALFPPVDLAKRLLVAGTRSKTGLELQIKGPMTLRLLPRVVLHMENVVLVDPATAGNSPVATARALDVEAGWAATLGAAHTLESVTLSDPIVVVDADKDGRLAWQPISSATRDPSPHISRAYSFNRVEIKGGTLSFRDQRTGMTARLERSDATLRGVSQDGIGEADVKAGLAVLLEPGSGTSVEVSNVDSKAKGLALSRIASLSASGETLRWRDRTQPTGVEASKFSASAEGLGLDGSGRITFNGGTVKWQDPATKTTLDAEGVETSAGTLRAARLGDVKFKSSKFAYTHPTNGSVSIGNLDGTAKSARLDAIEELVMSGGSISAVHPSSGRLDVTAVSATAKAVKSDGIDDVTVKGTTASYVHQSMGTVQAGTVTAAARNATLTRLQGLALSSATLSVGRQTRAAGAAAVELKDVSIAAPVLAVGTPLEASIAFVLNAYRVDGTVKLPAPETIAAGPSVPANVSLKASRGTVDFDGRLETAAAATVKGRVHATSNGVENLATWLGFGLPATVKGAADATGDIEATATRISLSDARVTHGANVASGTFAVDIAGARPKLSGRIAADKLEADAYLGLAPVAARPATQPKPAGGSKPQVVEPEVQLGDVFKTYMRAMLNEPVKRGGTLEIPAVPADQLIPAATRAAQPNGFKWSEDKFELSALRTMDIDVDWTVKSLGLRGMTFTVPQLKTVLDDGTLTLDGSDIGSNNGKLSGRARVDARQAVPAVSATVKGEGLDVRALFEATGVTPMLDGVTTLDADVRSTGISQKQIVEQLSGTVRTNMAEGHVLGYDLGNITFGTVIRWLTGNREYDPERRTPVTGLVTDLAIEKGVVKDSKVTMGGPLLGVNAEGTIGLVEQRLDLSGRARIASFFSGLPFRVFGSWSRPTVQPDLNLASVFSRAPPGEPTLADIVAGADIKQDPELALLIGRVIQKAGPGGLDAATKALLEGVQKRALGNP